jgi:membrane-associated protease RseP (regulator of RpoE activity)
MRFSLTTLVLLLPLVISGSACSNAGEGPQHALKMKLRANADSRRGYIGVAIQDLRPAQAREMQIPVKTGALVTEVVDESPAAQAGIMANDVIVEFNKTTIDDAAGLTEAVRKTEPGTKTSVTVVRKDQRKNLQVSVGTLPAPRELAIAPEIPMPPMQMNMNIFTPGAVNGLVLMELNPQLAEYFSAPEGKGVLVEQVQKRSAAKEAGIKAGDVILRVGDEEIGSVEDVHGAMEGLNEGDSVAVGILRRGTQMTFRMEVDAAQATGFFYRQHSGHPASDMKVFHLDRLKLQNDLRHLQEELRSVGRQIRGKMDVLRNTIRREVREAVS